MMSGTSSWSDWADAGPQPKSSKPPTADAAQIMRENIMRRASLARASVMTMPAPRPLEVDPLQPTEQAVGVQLITGLARIIGAQRHAAHAGQLLGRNPGIFLAVELAPEALVERATIHRGDLSLHLRLAGMRVE